MRVYAWYYWGSPLVLAENMIVLNGEVPFWGGNFLEGLAGVLVSPGRGLFVYSPFLLLALAGMMAAIIRRDTFLVPVAAGIVLYILTVAIWNNWYGGKSFGTRMLSETLPGGMLLAAQSMMTWWKDVGWRKATVLILAAWSVLVNYAGARHYPSVPFRGDKEEHRAVWSLQDTELVGCLDALRLRIEGHLAKFR